MYRSGEVVPAALDAVFNTMRAKVSAEHQPSMAEVIRDLSAAVKGTAAATAASSASETKGSSNFPLLAILASLLIGLGLGLAVGKFL